MEIEKHEFYSLKNLTSFKIGGAAEVLYFPKSADEFVYLLKMLENPLVFGQWSNVLISSAGIVQPVISTAKMSNISVEDDIIVAECGVKGPMLANFAKDCGLSGFEFMIGFPGSVGGNIFMNASAHSQAISDKLVSAKVFDIESSEVLKIPKSELGFGYRTSLMQKKPYILLSAVFKLDKKSSSEIDSTMKSNLDFRKVHQPSLKLPNVGSIFRNPPGDSAGRLLDCVGAKQMGLGGAIVWENHANFIVNINNATSQDVLELMFLMYNSVKDEFGIELEPEVRFVGERTEREVELCNILYKKK